MVRGGSGCVAQVRGEMDDFVCVFVCVSILLLSYPQTHFYVYKHIYTHTHIEHMFFSPERIDHMREMILAETVEERQKALDHLFVFQKEDMKGLFEVMAGKHVTIRLLDPPLHEFLPHEPQDIKALAARINKPVEVVTEEIKNLAEANPMMGFRGCRLTVRYPEITMMQVKAIITAALEVQATGAQVLPEIMIPLVATSMELEHIVPLVEAGIQEVFKAHGGATVPYRIGTMIEVPRACLTAEKIAPFVSFISYGTNDLTQVRTAL